MEEKKKDAEICGFCDEYDSDNCYCPHRGEMFEEDTCDGYTNESDGVFGKETK